MVAARPTWRGHLRLSLVSCPVMLFPGTTSGERIAFNTLSRASHNRLRQQMYDPESGEVVERQDQVKGYEFEKGRYVLVEPEEIDALRIESSQTIDIEHFVDRAEIDVLYWDAPYFMAPDGKFAQEAFAVIREAIRRQGVVGIGRVVLTSRERPVALQPRGKGLLVTRLRAEEEVRKPESVFDDIPETEVSAEMIAIAEQIIQRKRAPFQPAMFKDRYQEALQKLIEAKLQGETPVQPEVTEPGKVIDLFAALRSSLDAAGPAVGGKKPRAPSKKDAKATKTKQAKRRRA